MTAYRNELIIDNDIFDAIADGAKKAPGLMNTAVNRRLMPRIRKRILNRLQTMPAPAKHPIDWTSEKQRKFVMAKLRRENNLPYKRTGGLVKQWKVVAYFKGDNGEIIAENPSPIGRYVFGEQQQRFHRNTGWYHADDIILEESIIAQEQLIQTWFTVVDGSAGV
jgi:hypothetical protein